MRMVNKGNKSRYVSIAYDHPEHKFTSFAKYLSKELDGTAEDYIRTRE